MTPELHKTYFVDCKQGVFKAKCIGVTSKGGVMQIDGSSKKDDRGVPYNNITLHLASESVLSEYIPEAKVAQPSNNTAIAGYQIAKSEPQKAKIVSEPAHKVIHAGVKTGVNKLAQGADFLLKGDWWKAKKKDNVHTNG